MHSLLRSAGFALVLSASALCQTLPPGSNAPSRVALAGAGYRFPPAVLEVAPGQVIVLHIFGLTVTDSNRTVATLTASGFPHVLNGIAVDLVQGNPAKTTSLPLRAIYQNRCFQTSDCASMTGITLQIPFELETQSSTGLNPVLRITENGSPAGGVTLRPVSDSVHVMNTCDDTQTFIPAADSVPGNICAAVVMGQGALNSLYNLAHGGDQLAMWVYGMGAKTDTLPGCCNSPEQLAKPVQQFTINFDFRANATASPAVPGSGLTASPLFAAHVGEGTYQVNFQLPAVPAGLPACDGVKIRSNLTVTLTGSNSYDAAQICVAP